MSSRSIRPCPLRAAGNAAAASLFLLFTATAVAQSQFGQITGLVVDQTGGGVAGAEITVQNEQTGVRFKTVSNTGGNYVVTSLVPGTYSVSTTKPGFQSVTQTSVQLDLAQTARVDIKLPLGEVQQRVQVEASAVLLQTETASVSNVMPQREVIDLPLNGRNYLQLATLIPGATGAGLSGTFFGMPQNNLNVNGLRTSASMYMIDGADVMEQFNSGTPYTPAPDAIQEFRVETNNMTAQYGGGGAILNVALKSGTNHYHGDVYEFLRNDKMDARNFFALTKPELRRNQFGGVFGGPVKKDKLFFFVDYQGTRLRSGVTSNSIVPTADQRTGNFAGLKSLLDPYSGQPIPQNQIPASSMSPQTLFFLKFFPLANTAGGTYVQSATSLNDSDQFDVRLDYQIRAADLLTYTLSLQKGDVYSPGPFPLNGATFGPSQGEFTNLGWTHTFGPALVNQAHVSYARYSGNQTGQGIGTNYTEQAGIGGFELTSIAYPGPPQLTVNGYSSINGYAFYPLPQTYNHYNVGDILSRTQGKHTIQIGGDLRWYAGFNTNGARSRGAFTFTGVYTGDAWADYLFGLPFQGQRTFPRNEFGVYQRNQDLFVQDTWKLTKRLSLIGGLRWDVNHPQTALHNTYASTDPVKDQIIVSSDSSGQISTNAQQVTPIVLPLFQSRIVPSSKVGLPSSLVYTDWHAFAPRIGVAYQFSHDFVIRAGYGIFYPLGQGNQAISTGIVNPPFIVDELQNFNTTPVPTKTIANMFPPSSPGNVILVPPSFFQIQATQPDPYVQEWNFSIQKAIGRALSLQVAYVGSKGTDLTFAAPVNVPPPGPGPIQSRRENTFFAGGTYINDTGTSSYNGLQMTAETHGWHGLYVIGAFSWAKSMDLESSDYQGSPIQDPTNYRAEWGISDFDVAARFTVASTYQIPFLADRRGFVGTALGGWSVSNILTFQSGGRFTPSISTDPANNGTTKRPNQIAEGTLPNPTINDWFNVAAFAVPPNYSYGNSARNILSGPGTRNWDFAIFKSFTMGGWEAGRLQFRGEFFDFTNTPHFGNPNTNIQSSAAGKILSAAAPRSVQLSLKLLF